MTGAVSLLDDEEPIMVRSPSRDQNVEIQDTDASSDDDDDGEVSLKKRFEEIMRDLKSKKLNLSDPGQRATFITLNGSYLGEKTTADSDQPTLLHLIVDAAKDRSFDNYQPLVKLLLERHPALLTVKYSNEKTPLYIACSKKRRDNLIRFICSTYPTVDASLKTAYPKIDDILRIPCYKSENCVHVAIRRGATPAVVVFLAEHASEETLAAKDDKGNTPLHLAVEYDHCTDAQLDVVKALISRCDKAMDARTNSSLSPYQHHEYTYVEARKAAKEKEKEAAQEKKDEGNTAGGDTPAGKSNLGVKGQFMPKGPKPSTGITGPPLGPEPGRIRRANTGAEGSTGKHPFPILGSGSGEPKKPGLNTLTIASEGTGSNAKTPVTTENGEKKRERMKPKATDESAKIIKGYLKLHCIRTRIHDEAVDFLYGQNQEKQINFDLYDSPSLIISEERIERGLDHLKFEGILQYVALPNMRLEKKPVSKLRKSTKPDGQGRSDMIFLFNFLRDKEVKRIIRVIVDDTVYPPHSDEAIEKAVGGFKVEIWDWRKIDLCTDTILTAASDVKVVYLYWSGNNAVLRGWSEKGGLNLLKRLEKVHLHVEQGLETTKRNSNNLRDFKKRLKELRPEVEVEVVEDRQPDKHLSMSSPVGAANEQSQFRHKWLTCMDDFADFIQNVDPPPGVVEPITIALIDDGVDINEQSLQAKIIGGRSFCQRDNHQNLIKPHYVTSGGHGTVMASLICRVCPKAQLYVVKLDEHMSETSKRQITAKSAAKAVRAAVYKNVNIISMSWTIEKTSSNAADIQDLELAIQAAAQAGILMFCAANDQGIASNRSFPAATGGTKHLFKIGAAEASGAVWEWVGDPKDVDFIFPGHNVVKDRPNDAPVEKCKTLTGSSVATALASGLAALVLFCVQLSALNTQALNQVSQGANLTTIDDFRAMKGHERMREAFLAIGTSQTSGNKYIEVWKTFEFASKKAERVGRDRRIDIVVEVAGRLKTRQIFE